MDADLWVNGRKPGHGQEATAGTRRGVVAEVTEWRRFVDVFEPRPGVSGLLRRSNADQWLPRESPPPCGPPPHIVVCGGQGFRL